MKHNGQRLLKTRGAFIKWAQEIVGNWASDALENPKEFVAEAVKAHAPSSYPVIVAWKGVRDFDCWFVYPKDFEEPTDTAVDRAIAKGRKDYATGNYTMFENAEDMSAFLRKKKPKRRQAK